MYKTNEKLKISFKSSPFVHYKKIDEKPIGLYPKISLLSILQIILGLWMISFLYVGFQPDYIHYSIQKIPEWVATFRSISLFLISWFVVVSLFLLHFGIQEFKLGDKFLGYWLFFSLLLITSPIYLIYSLIQFGWNDFRQYIKNLFKDDPELSIYFDRSNWKYWLMFIVVIIMTPILVFTFKKEPMDNGILVIGEHGLALPPGHHFYTNFWYNSLQYFTIQTNLFCYLFALLFVLFPHKKIFKSNTYLIYCVTYLLIVGVTYDFALFPGKLVSGDIHGWPAYSWVKTLYEHVINPIVFCGSGIIILCQTKRIQTRDYLTTVKFGMIIPSVYLIYALLNVFVCNESVYGWFTNSNPNLWTNYAYVNSKFPSHGEPYFSLFILAYWFIFFGVITGFWSLDQWGSLRYFKKVIKGV